MRRIIFIFAAALLLAIPYGANAQLSFGSTVHDFGQVTVAQGPLCHTFVGKNTSGRPLVIQSVTTSCGCTVAKWDHREIAPGATTGISATYSNDEGPHPFDKTLTVKIAGIAKPVILHLRGMVQKEILPDSLVYTSVFGGAFAMMDTELKCGNLEQGGVRSDQASVANLSDGDILVSFENVSDGLSLDITPNPIPARSHATLRYTVSSRPDKWGYNYYHATAAINGKSSGKPLKVKAFTAENFTALSKEEKSAGPRPVFKESTFSFGHKKKGSIIHARFSCSNKGGKTLTIHKIDHDAIEGALTSGPLPQVPAGGNASFIATLDTSSLPKGEALVILTLTTNSPLRPIVTLFITGWID